MSDLFCQTSYNGGTLIDGDKVVSNLDVLPEKMKDREKHVFNTLVFGFDCYPNAKVPLFPCRNLIANIAVCCARLSGKIFNEFFVDRFNELTKDMFDSSIDLIVVEHLRTDGSDAELKLLYDNFYKLIYSEVCKGNYTISDNFILFVEFDSEGYSKMVSLNPNLSNDCECINAIDGVVFYRKGKAND